MLLLLLLTISSVVAADPLTCGHQCRKDFFYLEGADDSTDATLNSTTVFSFIDRGDGSDRWFDPNDPKDHQKCKGRNHSGWWTGPNREIINHFQVLGKVNDKEQIVRVYMGDKLIDVIQKPDLSLNEPITNRPSNALMDQNWCIWNCLGAEHKAIAPLTFGGDCTADYMQVKEIKDNLRDFGLGGYLGYSLYDRISTPGPACGYWSISIRTNFQKNIRIVREDFDPARASEVPGTMEADDYKSEYYGK